MSEEKKETIEKTVFQSHNLFVELAGFEKKETFDVSVWVVGMKASGEDENAIRIGWIHNVRDDGEFVYSFKHPNSTYPDSFQWEFDYGLLSDLQALLNKISRWKPKFVTKEEEDQQEKRK